LNPNKCVFGVPSGQLLRFLVSNRGIEASTKQIRATIEMAPPRYVKDVQKLTGSMVALNRFISWLGEKGLPFFKLLKKTGKFEWTEEAKEAFESLKVYLTSSPILTPPKKHEEMMLYISTSTVVSVAIVVEREEEGYVYKVQRPVYFVNEVLTDSTTFIKTTLRPPNHLLQDMALLRRPQDYRGNRFPSWSSIKSTKTGTTPKTKWTSIVLKYKN
jgi:hypothetical protein